MNTLNKELINDILDKDIIDLLDLKSLPPDKAEEFRQKALDIVNSRVFVRLTDILEQKKLISQFEVLDSADDQEIENFLSQNGILLKQIVAEEAVMYKAQMKTITEIIDAGLIVKDPKDE